ncbi:immunoglobulin-like domain-containing protein [Thermococcus sp.]
MKRAILMMLLVFGLVLAYQVLPTQNSLPEAGNRENGSINLNETLGPIVPAENASPLITLNKRVYSPNDTMELTIVNSGKTNLTTGYAFKLYRLENGTWKEVPLNLMFIEIAVIIEPGKSWEQRINLKDLNLEPGHYRIEKTVVVTDPANEVSMGIKAWAEFEVRG